VEKTERGDHGVGLRWVGLQGQPKDPDDGGGRHSVLGHPCKHPAAHPGGTPMGKMVHFQQLGFI
jgi:hypothetical protein